MKLYILSESALGYAIFENLGFEEVGLDLDEIQASICDYGRFSKALKLVSFTPFETAAMSLQNIMDISEGVVSETLKNTLDLAFSKNKKKIKLGVSDPVLGSSIKASMNVECISDDKVREISRGIRLHYSKLLGELKNEDLDRAHLGLGHAYSRSKVKFNVNRIDNMIIQSICLLDQLDKDINKFYMRAREWYSWAFPELGNYVTENITYLKIVQDICSKPNLLKSDDTTWLTDLGLEKEVGESILKSSKMSMGTDISASDTASIKSLVGIIIGMLEYREKLFNYLTKKMDAIAPNLAALIGITVGARLISHAGSLTNLSKYPASTVQIIGAEKALFRALKTRGKTPKYGLIYNSSFINSASQSNKGRISRSLANKCSLASRIDCFLDTPTSIFGEKLHEQMLERMKFYETGKAPKKNIDVMSKACSELNAKLSPPVEEASSKSKRKTQDNQGDEEKPKKKSKKDAKVKKSEKDLNEESDKGGKKTNSKKEDKPKTQPVATNGAKKSKKSKK